MSASEQGEYRLVLEQFISFICALSAHLFFHTKMLKSRWTFIYKGCDLMPDLIESLRRMMYVFGEVGNARGELVVNVSGSKLILVSRNGG